VYYIFCCNLHYICTKTPLTFIENLKIKAFIQLQKSSLSDDDLNYLFRHTIESVYLSDRELTPIHLSTFLFPVDIMIKIPSPLNLAKWLDANEDKLKPPIGNYMLQVGNGTQVMAVGGPNARTDFHINETEVCRANPCYHFSEVILFCSL
jgi:hypothetical protein